MREPFELADVKVAAGTAEIVDIPLGVLSDHTPMTLTVQVRHGKLDGPVMFVSAAIHGDEILGVEIIRRLCQLKTLRRLRGTLLSIPIVNAYGFLGRQRYTPDGRDLNRSFPGSAGGSLAGQLADVFMNEVVRRSEVGIDLHTAARHRVNLPQIRANLESDRVKELAQSFGAPVILDSNLRDGSLRQAAQDVGVDILLYEAGEALRFDEIAIRGGVRGVVGVMRKIGMLPEKPEKSDTPKPSKSVVSRSSRWLRATRGGIFRGTCQVGKSVVENETLGYVADPFGESEDVVLAPSPGIVIGRTNLPVVNQGDALFHIAKVGDAGKAESRVERIGRSLEDDPLFDDADIL